MRSQPSTVNYDANKKKILTFNVKQYFDDSNMLNRQPLTPPQVQRVKLQVIRKLSSKLIQARPEGEQTKAY